MRTLRFGRLLVTELGTLLAVGWAIAVTMILPKNVFHFHELVITTYTNGTMDFSTDATMLVRSLGIVSLLTLILGLVIGATMGLARPRVAHVREETNEYEHALATAGFMKITHTPDRTTYQLTEHGRRFLREYAFLDREVVSVHKSDCSETLAE